MPRFYPHGVDGVRVYIIAEVFTLPGSGLDFFFVVMAPQSRFFKIFTPVVTDSKYGVGVLTPCLLWILDKKQLFFDVETKQKKK